MSRSPSSLAAALVLALAACSGGADPAEPGAPAPSIVAETGRTFELRVGSAARIGGPGGPVIAFRGVSDDSRCPIDVTCVWQGDAEVHLRVTSGSAQVGIDLHTGIEPRAAAAFGRTVRLIGLAPEPRSDQPVRPGDYIATLRVD